MAPGIEGPDATERNARIGVRDNARASRFEAVLDEEIIGILLYQRPPGTLELIHTVTDPDHRHEGAASALVRTALAEARANTIALMPPQVYLLSTLADVLTGNENTPLQRERIRVLAEGAFGRMVMQPLAAPRKDEQGRTIFLYEGDEARGGAKGCLHRCIAKFQRNGVREALPFRACLRH